MPARTLKFQTGEYYHIYNRGVAHQSIFRTEANYIFVLRRMRQFAAAYQIRVIAYCLMHNHYHWLVRQDGDTAAGMLPQHVFNSYTKAYNKMYECKGTLFETRYKAKHIGTDEYLLHLCRYIHANPIKDGITANLAEWPYSNYHEWVNIRSGSLVDQEFIDNHFPERERYKAFVEEYILQRHLPHAVTAYLQELED